MKILITCEESQSVTIAFRKRGFEAYSNDILPCSGGHPEWHLQGNALNYLDMGWDVLIGHPPCTYLCNSGVRWLKNNPARYRQMRDGAAFFKMLWGLPIPYIGLENSIPHKHAQLPEYSQIIRPWEHGHKETKAACLWLKNLPLVRPTNIVGPPPKGKDKEERLQIAKEWNQVHRCPPGPQRATIRSKTPEGIAEALADQWGTFLLNQKN